MMNLLKDIVERLIICWYVLTKRNYIYFGIGKNPIIWNEDGSYRCVKPGGVKFYTYFDQFIFYKNGNVESSLHDLTWDTVIDIANKALKGEY